MPQMAPMMWLNLFMIFSITFIIFLVVNYFNKNLKKISMTSSSVEIKKMNWKW